MPLDAPVCTSRIFILAPSFHLPYWRNGTTRIAPVPGAPRGRRFCFSLLPLPALARVDHVEHAAKALAADATEARRNGLSDELKVQASARAKGEETLAPPVSTETAAAAATGSGIADGFTEQLAAASSQLSPFRDAIHVVKYALLCLALASIGLTLYAVWHRARIKAATG